MIIYSQRDSRWANDFLGTSTTDKIGLYGCLITCFSSYIGKTPDLVNNTLKNNGGFTSGDLFIWSKCTILGLNQTYVSPKYTSAVTSQGLQKIKDFLDQGYPLICEVDFNPNTDGEEMHFVLITRYEGDSFYAMDPWVGEIINLSVYGGAARAVIQFRAYDKKINTQPAVQYNAVGQAPQYLLTLLQENSLSLSNEGQIRDFFQKAIDFDGVKKDLDNAKQEYKSEFNKWASNTEYFREKIIKAEDALERCQTQLQKPPETASTSLNQYTTKLALFKELIRRILDNE